VFDAAAPAAVHAHVRCLAVPGRADDHRADRRGGDLRAVHRPVRRSRRPPADHRRVGVDADAGDGTGGDVAVAGSADRLAVRSGRGHPGHFRQHRRLHSRSVAAVAYMTGTILDGFTGRAVAGLVAADVDWHAAFVALAILTGAAAALIAWR